MSDEPIQENAKQKTLQAFSEKLKSLWRRLPAKGVIVRYWPLLCALFLIGMWGGIWRSASQAGRDASAKNADRVIGEAVVNPVPEITSMVAGEGEKFAKGLDQLLSAGNEIELAPVSPADFVRPCPGRISDKFGWRRDKATGTWRLYAGVFLSATQGSAVVAIASGRIARVERDPLQGTLVAVDHDRRWRSIYGRLGEALVSPGDMVAAGQVIGRAGTGPEGGYGVYFAIYRDGEPQDPAVIIPGL